MRSDNKFVPEAKAHKWLLSAPSVASQTDTQPSRGEHREIQLGVPYKPREIRTLQGPGELAGIVSVQSRQE